MGCRTSNVLYMSLSQKHEAYITIRHKWICSHKSGLAQPHNNCISCKFCPYLIILFTLIISEVTLTLISGIFAWWLTKNIEPVFSNSLPSISIHLSFVESAVILPQVCQLQREGGAIKLYSALISVCNSYLAKFIMIWIISNNITWLIKDPHYIICIHVVMPLHDQGDRVSL